MPQRSVGTQPVIDLDEGFGPQAVDPPLRLLAYVDQTGLPQHPQVSRHAGAGDRERVSQLACCRWMIAENLKDGASTLVGQRLQHRVHPAIYPTGYVTATLRTGPYWLVILWPIRHPRGAVRSRSKGPAPPNRSPSPTRVWALTSIVEREWDVTRRRAILEPPAEALETLITLRSEGVKIGVLSNTHALELRSWPESPLSSLVDGVALSHEIGAVKPRRAAYDAVLERIGVPAGGAAYVGDGSNDELVGAREAGFALIVLAAEAPMRFSPDRLPVLRVQADVVLSTLGERPAALMEASTRSSRE